jgi:hypothetical protein
MLCAPLYRNEPGRDGVLSCSPVSSPQRRVMPASLQKFSGNRLINPNSERLVQCPYCLQKYLPVLRKQSWIRAVAGVRLVNELVLKLAKVSSVLHLLKAGENSRLCSAGQPASIASV